MEHLRAKANRLKESMDIEGLIQDRKYKLKVYKQCFTGKEAVSIMISTKIAKNIDDAVIFGNTLIEFKIISHVTNEHSFKNESFFYHFINMDLSESSKPNLPYIETSNTQQISSPMALSPLISPISPNSKERITMSQLCFRLESEFYSLSTTINICETFLNMNKGIAADLNEQKMSGKSVVNKEYLAQIQSDIHKYLQRIELLSKKQKEISQNNDYNEDVLDILNKCNVQIRRIEDMFFALNSAFIKQKDPNYASQQIKKKGQQKKYGKILKDGYLIKQGAVRKSWKLRLFILTSDGYLRYYDQKQRLLNEIDLAQAQFVSVENKHSHYNKPFVFTVKVPNREFVFAADNENIRKSWIGIIQSVMLQKSKILDNDSKNVQHEILYKLSKLEWSQLQNNDTFADLAEYLEEIADIKLIKPNKLQIIATSDLWISRHQNENENGNEVNVEWDEMFLRVRQFFERAHGDIIMQGWLLKKMEFRNWKRRWIVLRKDYKLDYYANMSTNKKKGSINLSNMKSVREIYNDVLKSDPDFMFEVENNDRRVRFAANNFNELKLWMNTIQKHCIFMKIERANSDSSDWDMQNFQKYAQNVPKQMIDPIIV